MLTWVTITHFNLWPCKAQQARGQRPPGAGEAQTPPGGRSGGPRPRHGGAGRLGAHGWTPHAPRASHKRAGAEETRGASSRHPAGTSQRRGEGTRHRRFPPTTGGPTAARPTPPPGRPLGPQPLARCGAGAVPGDGAPRRTGRGWLRHCRVTGDGAVSREEGRAGRAS